VENSPELPAPLRGNEPGTFTHHSVAVRLPEIATRVLAENDLDPAARAAIAALIDEIAGGVITQLGGQGPEAAAWDSYVAPHLGESWLDVPWFFAEYYFYRRVLDAVGYWNTGTDPYRAQKQLGLDQAIDPARETIAAVDAEYAQWVSTDVLLIQLTDAALWGNQVDLSLWPAIDGERVTPELEASRFLLDDRPRAIRTLGERIPPTVDIVLDNVGSELIADLLVADMLLRSDLASRVRLHVKQYPVFVSDATSRDVAVTVQRMAADSHRHLRGAGERLRVEFDVERLEVTVHPYWVSPLGWRERPEDLEEMLHDSGLVLVKGDANYRRLVDDRHWDFTTPFSTAVGSTPAPLLALRTLKSEVAAGLEAASVEHAAATDPEWLQNGRWAVAAFMPGQGNP
jgi:uncharacterized protein with ATP-grasp and redox domains